MIDLNNFDHGFKKVNHNLNYDWDWNEIKNIMVSSDEKYYRDLGKGGFTLGGLNTHKYCSNIVNFLQNQKPEYYARAGLYASVGKNSQSFSYHKDDGQYLWIWQIIGDTPWCVDGINFKLNCGEVLYISPGIYHQAIPDSPRASITFSLEQFE